MNALTTWPPPSWLAVLAATLIVVISVAGNKYSVRRRNRSLESLREPLRTAAGTASGSEFSVSGSRNVLLVSGDQLTVVDRLEPKVVRTYELRQLIALKIVESNPRVIDFRLVFHGGAESRSIDANHIGEFARLFEWISQAGKPVQYVSEDAP